MSDFCTEHTIKRTRKWHVCEECRTRIDAGSPAIRFSGVSDGDFFSQHQHIECRAAAIALRTLHDLDRYDDGLWLHEVEHEDWPWPIEEHPVVAGRLNLQKRLEEKNRESA